MYALIYMDALFMFQREANRQNVYAYTVPFQEKRERSLNLAGLSTLSLKTVLNVGGIDRLLYNFNETCLRTSNDLLFYAH